MSERPTAIADQGVTGRGTPIHRRYRADIEPIRTGPHDVPVPRLVEAEPLRGNRHIDVRGLTRVEGHVLEPDERPDRAHARHVSLAGVHLYHLRPVAVTCPAFSAIVIWSRGSANHTPVEELSSRYVGGPVRA